MNHLRTVCVYNKRFCGRWGGTAGLPKFEPNSVFQHDVFTSEMVPVNVFGACIIDRRLFCSEDASVLNRRDE